ncbi:AmmeMemoRadiSam system radical SAM enzyme [bacterium]|nr:AmmeMemoRadiSam system radical SAM enzyme [bacterium]
MYKAKYWETEKENIRCMLCPHKCLIAEGKTGICRVRENIDGELIAKSYNEVISVSVDPIEKKPLYHFFPESDVLSIGPRGCNFSCSFCQNWHISQEDGKTLHITPEMIVSEALSESSVGIAYTYTEPIVAFEFVRDISQLARMRGLQNIMVTNGFINEEPLEELIDLIDAMNIDLKSMNDEFYRSICGGKLKPVLETIKRVAASDVHLEITNLLITGMNDSEEQIIKLVDFIASINPEIPVHFSSYHPAYKLDLAPTPNETLYRAFEIAKEKLRYIYIGNKITNYGRNTYCPECGNLLVSREGFCSQTVGITSAGKCQKCNRQVDIEGKWNR